MITLTHNGIVYEVDRAYGPVNRAPLDDIDLARKAVEKVGGSFHMNGINLSTGTVVDGVHMIIRRKMP